jgi:hypothetical protein
MSGDGESSDTIVQDEHVVFVECPTIGPVGAPSARCLSATTLPSQARGVRCSPK